MPHTIDLLNRALEIRNAAQWCSRFNMTRATITNAKKRGRLSPSLAGNLAMEIGADPIFWTAVAAAEAEPAGPLRDRLERSLERQKTVVLRQPDDMKKRPIAHPISGLFVAYLHRGEGRREDGLCRRPVRSTQWGYPSDRGSPLRDAQRGSGGADAPR